MTILLLALALMPAGTAKVISTSPPSDYLEFHNVHDGDYSGTYGLEEGIPVNSDYGVSTGVNVTRLSGWDAYRVVLLMDHGEVRGQEIANRTVPKENLTREYFREDIRFSAGHPGTRVPLEPGTPIREYPHTEEQLGEYWFHLNVTLLRGDQEAVSEVPGSAIHALLRLNVTDHPEQRQDNAIPVSGIPIVLALVASVLAARRHRS